MDDQDRESDDLQAALRLSRRAEGIGWTAIGAVVGLCVLAVLAVGAAVLLFCIAAVSVTD
ncbi:hypothetical protein ACFYOG_03515 [Streptomyces sp. NPDC007818]|uniref:hypothetical protein n=1 Tax=Streptomyces sp. NPDC007818 TaxID=3364780 RepID=UPI0036A54C80